MFTKCSDAEGRGGEGRGHGGEGRKEGGIDGGGETEMWWGAR